MEYGVLRGDGQQERKPGRQHAKQRGQKRRQKTHRGPIPFFICVWCRRTARYHPFSTVVPLLKRTPANACPPMPPHHVSILVCLPHYRPDLRLLVRRHILYDMRRCSAQSAQKEACEHSLNYGVILSMYSVQVCPTARKQRVPFLLQPKSWHHTTTLLCVCHSSPQTIKGA